MSEERVDVVIVGAGFTGLVAADTLIKAGVSITVLEGRDRAGGRVESVTNGLGERIDTGGQFICEDMPGIMALAASLGIALVETPNEGDFVVQPPAPFEAGERDYADAMAIRDRMGGLDPADSSVRRLNVGAWLARQPDSLAAKQGFRSMVEGLWCRPIDEVPLWYLISNDRRITNETYELQYFPSVSMQGIADTLAGKLDGRVHLKTPVTRIDLSGTIVRVETDRAIWEAKAAIIAVPPVAASRIVISPELPRALRDALSAWTSGAVIKAFLRYKRAFWRDAGLSGTVMWREMHGLFACDASHSHKEPGIVAFIAGPLAMKMRGRGPAGLQAWLVERLAEALGPDAARPLDITLRDWTDDPWSGGGYSDVITEMAAFDVEDVLRAGFGNLLFASSELSPSFPGYVEGAIVAGREAAARVIAEIRRSS